MSTVEIVLLSVALAMDAFAVSLCKGLSMKNGVNYKNGAVIALYFGAFQAVMPAIGYLLGSNFEKYIVSVDHWIAFVLLSVIGAKMVIEAVRGGEEVCDESGDKLNHRELALLAVATSIDALAVGITFAFLRVNVVGACSLIGIITFAICFVGIIIGNKFGERYKTKAEIFGGAVLILIGLKILLEHLGVIAF